MPTPLDTPGGEKLWVAGELITLVSQRRIQWIADQGVLNLLAAGLLWDLANDAPRNGFLGDGCAVSVVAGLNIEVAAGIGFFYDATITDVFKASYLPIVVAAADSSQSCDARDANPRIDVVSLAPNTDTDTTESVGTKVGGVIGSSSTAQRQFYTYTMTITKGTAAAVPVAPATPTGHVKVAEINVPATVGALVVRDCRPILQIGDRIAPVPGREYHSNWVPGASSELEVTESATPSMVLRVAGGAADIYGQRLRFAPQTVTVTTAHATLDRHDLVLAYADGTMSVLAGTPAFPATTPDTPVDAVCLARVNVDATVTTLGTAVIYDTRLRYPINGADHVADATLTAAKQSVVPVIPYLSAAAEAGDVITVTGSLKDADGVAVQRIQRLYITLRTNELAESSGYGIAVTTGTRVTSAHGVAGSASGMLIDTTSTGAFVLDITDSTTGANRGRWLRVEPVNTPGTASVVDCPFN